MTVSKRRNAVEEATRLRGAREARKAPARSRKQRLSALEEANRIRSVRKKLKRELKEGQRHLRALLVSPPPDILTMRAHELLCSARGLGRVKVDRMFWKSGISSTKTVGGLTDHQRSGLLRQVGHR